MPVNQPARIAYDWTSGGACAWPLPAGDYTIVECLGHRTLVGRCEEVERFGTRMLSIEPTYNGELLPAVLIGGGSLYAFTSCTAAVALERCHKTEWNLPVSLRAMLPTAALPAPEDEAGEFAPAFLDERLGASGDFDREVF